MEKNVKVSILLDIYGKLLTEKQFKLLNDYYNNDLSLSEIAENERITRQAVRDNLKKGENKLLQFEEKLLIMKKTIEKEGQISKILNELTKIDKNLSDKKISDIVKDIKEKLNELL